MTDREIIQAWSDKQYLLQSLPCPCCGKIVLLRKQLLTPKAVLSRRADVFICNLCANEEANEGNTGEGKPLSEWYCVKIERGKENL